MEYQYEVEMRNNIESRNSLYSLVQDLTKTDDFWFLGMRKYRTLGHPFSVSLGTVSKRERNKQRVQASWSGQVGRNSVKECEADINLNDMEGFVRTLYEGEGYSYLSMGFESWNNVKSVRESITSLGRASPDFTIKFKRSKIHVYTNDPSLEKKLVRIKTVSDSFR